MLDEDDQVYEVPHPRVIAVTVVPEHSVELLGGVAVDVDDLNERSENPCEVE